ncbi:MAG: hypothetical protein OXH75_15200 [Acidobacteria bacterium]|nr:hypothetical protein [Acidobacteriota bacterium]
MTQPSSTPSAAKALVYVLDGTDWRRIPGLTTFIPDRPAPTGPSSEPLLGEDPISVDGIVGIGNVTCACQVYDRFDPAWDIIAAAYRPNSRAKLAFRADLPPQARGIGSVTQAGAWSKGVVTVDGDADAEVLKQVNIGNQALVGDDAKGIVTAVSVSGKTIALGKVGGSPDAVDPGDNKTIVFRIPGRRFASFEANVDGIPGGGFQTGQNVGQGGQLVLRPTSVLPETVYWDGKSA